MTFTSSHLSVVELEKTLIIYCIHCSISKMSTCDPYQNIDRAMHILFLYYTFEIPCHLEEMILNCIFTFTYVALILSSMNKP